MTPRPRCFAWLLVSSAGIGALVSFDTTLTHCCTLNCFPCHVLGEYRLLNTMITSEMRKDPDGEGASWDVLYTKIEKVTTSIPSGESKRIQSELDAGGVHLRATLEACLTTEHMAPNSQHLHPNSFPHRRSLSYKRR